MRLVVHRQLDILPALPITRDLLTAKSQLNHRRVSARAATVIGPRGSCQRTSRLPRILILLPTKYPLRLCHATLIG
jgi:hypothetical protein